MLAAVISVVNVDSLAVDNDGDGVADPGDQIHYTVTVQNSGDASATGLTFQEIINDPNLTLVADSINVSPLAINDTFTAAANTQLVVGNATPLSGPHSTVAGNVLANDTEFLGDTYTISTFDATSAQGGTVSLVTSGVNAGSFTYAPGVGDTGADTFTYTIRDNGIDGVAGNSDDLISVGTVTINIGTTQVWYVDNSAGTGGNGTSTNPFDSLADVSGGAGPDGAGDIIYVSTGSGNYTGGITLQTNQTLWGQGEALIVDSFTLQAAGTDPIIENAGGDGVTLASGNTLKGFTVGNTLGFDITNTAATSVGTLTVSNVILNGTGGLFRADSGGALSVTLDSAGTTSASGHGIQLVNTSGNFTRSAGAMSGVSGTDVLISGGTVSATIRGDITKTSNSAMVSISGGHATGTITFQNGGLVATNGTGLQFDNADGTYNFNDQTNLSAGDAGIDIVNGSSGTFNFGASTGIINPTGIAYREDTSTANVTYSGAINKGNNANSAVDINAKTGGTTTFAGQITASTTTANAIDLTNTGGTVNFTGGLALTTTSGVAFNATGSGATVSATQNNTSIVNTIATTTGTALNVTNTTIGASGLTFRSISSNGAVNGIVLNNTGASGGLTVSGDSSTSANGSGGVIQNSTGAGISLTSTRDVSLDQMNITNGGDDGIHGVGVVNFTLNRSNVTGNGNSTSDDGLQFGEASGTVVGVTGNVSILATSISGNAHNGVHIRNTSNTIDNLTVTNSTFSNVNDTFGANAFLIEASGTSTITEAFLTGNTFSNNDPQRALEVQAHDTATISDFVVSDNIFTNNGIHASFTQDGSSNLEFYFVNNGTVATPMNAVATTLSAVNLFSSSQSTGGTIVGTISGNQINMGSVNALGIRAVIQGQTDATLLIDGNTVVNDTSGNRCIAVSFLGPANPLAGTLGANTVVSDVTITNNTANNTTNQAFPLASISVEADNQTGAFNKSPTVRADIRGNIVPASSAFDLTSGHIQFYEYDGDGTAGEFQDGIGQLVDTGTASANADAQLASTNTGSVGSFGISLIAGPINVPPPVPTPLMFVPTPNDVPPSPNPPTDYPPSAIQPPTGDPLPANPSATPQTASEPAVIVDDGVLSQAELDSLVAAAIARWEASGLTAEQLALLQNVTFTVEDLPGWYLGSAGDGIVTLDSNAAGNAWFIDATPLDDSEFSGAGTDLDATAMGGAAGRVDALTAIMHELGHQLGLDDSYSGADSTSIMFGWLQQGERRLPAAGQADGADPLNHEHDGPDFLFGAMNIGTLPAGYSITIVYDATVDSMTNGVAPKVTSQVRILGDGGINVLSDDPAIAGVANPTETQVDGITLGDLVWGDTDANGLFNGLETGINGVTVNLYVDVNTNGVLDVGDGAAVATTTTAGGGLYSFSVLPGEYLVEIAASNFQSGGVLEGMLSTGGSAIDPDNNTNNDDNGVNNLNAAVNGISSQAITLNYNTEPTADGTGQFDINNTLDFGFVANIPPVLAVPGNITYTEDDPATAIAPGLMVVDTDSATLANATITITNFVAGQDVLAFTNDGLTMGNISVVTNVGGVLTLTSAGASATTAEWQAALRAVTYVNTSNTPNTT